MRLRQATLLPTPSLLPELPGRNQSGGQLGAAWERSCRPPGPRGHALPGQPLARGRNREGCAEFAATAAAARLYSQSCSGWGCQSGGSAGTGVPRGMTLPEGPRFQQPHPGTMRSPRLCCPHRVSSAVGPEDEREEKEKYLSFCSGVFKEQNLKCLSSVILVKK